MHGLSIHKKVAAELEAPIRLQELLIRLIRKYGITHTTSQYKAAMKEKEDVLFKLVRVPAKTSTGRQSRSMDHEKVQITVSAIPQEGLLLQ